MIEVEDSELLGYFILKDVVDEDVVKHIVINNYSELIDSLSLLDYDFVSRVYGVDDYEDLKDKDYQRSVYEKIIEDENLINEMIINGCMEDELLEAVNETKSEEFRKSKSKHIKFIKSIDEVVEDLNDEQINQIEVELSEMYNAPLDISDCIDSRYSKGLAHILCRDYINRFDQ